MKKNLRYLFIAFSLLLQTAIFGNTFIIKGYVVDANNKAVANKTVRIYTDSTSQTCPVSHTKMTNPNGYYIDTVTCNGDIRILYVAVEDCSGKTIINQPSLTGISNIIESNFTICAPTTVAKCYASFSFQVNPPVPGTTSNTPMGTLFNSTGSLAAAGDSIISRVWVFGDSSTPITGNQIVLSHNYAKPGSYNACLTIKTAGGCESNYCTTVLKHDSLPNPPQTPTTCKASFTYTLQGYRISVNSAGSVAATASDSILNRNWYFGDSTGTVSMTGNNINSSYTFSKPGVYMVYLSILTKSGCTSKYSISVTVKDTTTTPIVPTNCKAVFTYNIHGDTLFVNSLGSLGASSTDSIISRTWYFGDSSNLPILNGNYISTSHIYAKAGTYPVYLSIVTKSGCASRYSTTITIKDTTPVNTIPTSCKANFSYTIQGYSVKLNSVGSIAASATDSILNRNWYFGDSTGTTTLGGNIIDPSHNFAKPGTYPIYLSILTKSGCVSKYSTTITIKDTTPINIIPTSCKAYFNYTIQGYTVKLNSAGSVAASATDSILNRNWYFGDSSGTTTLGGNIIDPIHSFAKPGTYPVYLSILTKSGCVSKYSTTVIIKDTIVPIPTTCKANFTYTMQGYTVTLNSIASVAATQADSIISRTWYFGDSITTTSSITGNQISPSHTYAKPGTYSVYLAIKTKLGCASSYLATIIIKDTLPPTPIPTSCKAYFTYTLQGDTIRLNSSGSVAASSRDSILSRAWYFSDANASTAAFGSGVTYTHVFAKPGTYTVYLSIKTAAGCESRYSVIVVIHDTIPTPQPLPTNCNAVFSYTLQAASARFTSANSKAGTVAGSIKQDSIISRIWIFGDSTSIVTGNTVDPSHTYTKTGTYQVYLYIKTSLGCESKYTSAITIGPNAFNCNPIAQFTAENISLKAIQYNSELSKAQAGDTIVQRLWQFGDSSQLSGNVINPVKQFDSLGYYNTCLQIQTARGCTASVCKEVIIKDTTTVPQTTVDYVKIISINPNPVSSQMVLTVWSKNTNAEAEIAIYDIYGNLKWSSKKLLPEGNTIINIATGFLYHGPYFLKVLTKDGKDSKQFYKL